MKTLILIFAGLLMLISPLKAQESQNVQQSEPQSKEFADIEKYISRLHHEIENDYKIQLIELNRHVQAEIDLLAVPDKACTVASLAGQAEVAKAVLKIDSYGYRTGWDFADETKKMVCLNDKCEPYGYFNDNIEISPKLFAEAQSQIVERKYQILKKLEWETYNLEQQKQYALTIRLPQLEKRLKDNLLKPEPQPQATHGVVTGIIYSADKPSAIVDSKIVHNGDSIYDVTVVQIYKDKIEFEKNGKKWEQKVQQKPGDYWK
jgi:hypothetical protein